MKQLIIATFSFLDQMKKPKANTAVWFSLWSAGHGAYLRGPVPGGRVGLLRRVQPAGGEDAVGRVPAGPVHPGGPEGAQQPQQGQKYVRLCR